MLRNAHGRTIHLRRSRAGSIQVYPQAACRRGVKVPTHTGHQARNVGRAAGAIKPFGAVMRTARGQRVLIEEAQAIQRDTAQHAVVERALKHICVAPVPRKLQQALIPKHHANCSAGLRICSLVRQVVRVCKALIAGCRPDAAGDIHALVHNTVPQALTGGQQACISVRVGHICHGGIEIHGTHGVPGHHSLLAHRQV